MSFIHLHNHTDYSLLDGVQSVADMVKRVESMGQGAVALTDHGVLFGAVKLMESAKEHGIKPILGTEAYIATTEDHTDAAKHSGDHFHLTMLAQNKKGYLNLVRLSSLAHTEGLSYKPRISHNLMEKHSDGVIILSGCVAGELPQLIMEERNREANDLLDWYQRVYGDRFFIEVQYHGGTGGIDHVRNVNEETGEILWTETDLNAALVSVARKRGIGIVATNDAHYSEPHQGAAQDAALCLQTGRWLGVEDRMKFPGRDDASFPFYMKSEEEMRQASDADWWQEACDNTEKVAAMIEDGALEVDRQIMPKYTPPPEIESAFLTWQATGSIDPRHWRRGGE